MTTYSVLASGPRTAVVASWPGMLSDIATKVTSIEDRDIAIELASALTTLSEGSWYAAAWLDTWDPIARYLQDLSTWLRLPHLTEDGPKLDLTGCRHTDVDSSFEMRDVVDRYLPSIARLLSHPQRLGVAEEIDTELTEIRQTLKVLAGQGEPEDESRGWQFLEVTREHSFGLAPYLPDAAAGWLATMFSGDLIFAQRWHARGILLRIEQLAAACVAVGGRSTDDNDPLRAHCVFHVALDHPRIINAEPTPVGRSPFGPFSAYGPLKLRVDDPDNPDGTVHTEADPYDTEALATALGDWVLAVPMRA